MLIVCNGMKRSGSTLQYNLAASILAEASIGVGQGWVPREQLDPQATPLLDWLADDQCHAIKSHKLLPGTSQLLESGQLKVLYSFRDVRDVAASSIRTFDNVHNIEDACRLIDEALEAEALLGNKPNVLRQSYEQLTRNTPEAIAEICRFLSVELSKAAIDRIAQHYAIDQVQRNIERKKRIYRVREFFRPILERLRLLMLGRTVYRTLFSDQLREIKKSLVRDNHVSSNRGKSGAWDDILSSEDLAMLQQRYGAWLQANGYAE
jgi:hypothetical protein